uniref:Neuropeptide-like protein 31 n=1 Tax=Syphacia muris TaxID=451379 RepID=A0A0N5AU15_9BILA
MNYLLILLIAVVLFAFADAQYGYPGLYGGYGYGGYGGYGYGGYGRHYRRMLRRMYGGYGYGGYPYGTMWA